MKIYTKNSKSYQATTLIELIIALAVFTQLITLTWNTLISAINLNEFNKANRNVNLEIYNSIINWIWSYIRRGTWIMYSTHKLFNNNEKIGLKIIEHNNLDNFERKCNEQKEYKAWEFDRLTIFQNKDKTKYITFAVEQIDWPSWKTSRIVYRKNKNKAYYLTSENTFISCFLVSVSPNPYIHGISKHTKDIQPYVQIEIAWRYRYLNQTSRTYDSFFRKNTYVSYKTTFTLRNYIY